MHYVYTIESELTDKYYVGYTSDYNKRWSSHKYTHTYKKSKLYDCMKRYGFDNFEMVLVASFNNKQDAIDLERSLISLDDDKCLNLVPGGEGGFVIQDMDDWTHKLSKARAGRKPALGMKHTEENKELFSICGKLRWDIYGRYPKEVIELPFSKSHKLYGISRTHYYRLLKQAKNNGLG